MTRILVRDASGPQAVRKDDVAGDTIWVCRCGLSRDQPFCDGSHRATRDEPPSVLVRYVDRDGGSRREAVVVQPVAETADAGPVPPTN